ncbi:MAG: hypothetical protein AB4372_05835 [Xenococcus sp. (in: cyanobacteria)]
MNKQILAISGVFVLLGAMGLSIYLWLATSDARSLDRFKKDTLRAGESCLTPLEEDNITISRRIMSENDSLGLRTSLHNSDKNKNCEVVVSLNAQNFQINPDEPDRIINLPPLKNGSISWILSPRDNGLFAVAVSTESTSQIVGIKVTDGIIGLLSEPFASRIGYILGPMMTIPWWLERWEKWKQQKQNKNKSPVEH